MGITSRRTLSILYTLHSWAGIVTGLLMFVVCFSGAVVVFKHEIDLWANPALKDLPRAAVPAGPDAVLAALERYAPGARVERLQAPDEVSPVWFVFAKLAPDARNVKLAARADSGEIVGPVDSQLGQFIRTLHVFLFFGPRWIVGFLGVAMFFLIVSGTIIHRKVLRELFTLRWGRSFRLIASDFHKAAGVWGLLFHGLIAFTGAWLGLAPVFERAYEHLVSPPAVAAAVSRAAASPTHGPDAAAATSRSVDALMQQAAHDVPGLVPRVVSFRPGKADAAATVIFYGGLSDSLYDNASVTYGAGTGALIDKRDPRERGFWSSFNGLMAPLHFGDFGSLVLKWLYFLLGLLPAALSLSGTLIWIDRRKHRRAALAPTAAVAPRVAAPLAVATSVLTNVAPTAARRGWARV